MAATSGQNHHGIKDNHNHGRVADFLTDKIAQGSRLSVVSAYFTIYAYEALSKELDGIESLRFLFGEPRFIKSLDPEKTDKKAFKIEDEGLALTNRLDVHILWDTVLTNQAGHSGASQCHPWGCRCRAPLARLTDCGGRLGSAYSR